MTASFHIDWKTRLSKSVPAKALLTECLWNSQRLETTYWTIQILQQPQSPGTQGLTIGSHHTTGVDSQILSWLQLKLH